MSGGRADSCTADSAVKETFWVAVERGKGFVRNLRTEIKAGLEFATSCWEIQITAVRFSRRLDCVDDVIDNCYTLFPTIPVIAGRDNSNYLGFLKEKHCTLFFGSFNIAQVYYLKNFIIFYHFTFYHNFKSRWYLVYFSGIQQIFLIVIG